MTTQRSFISRQGGILVPRFFGETYIPTMKTKMIKRTMFSAAALMALTFQPAAAQQHEHGDTQFAGP